MLIFCCLPGLLSFKEKNTLQLMMQEIDNTVRYARVMANLYNLPLVLSPLPDHKDWAAGMVLFIDNKQHKYTEQSTLLYKWQWHHPGLHVLWTGFMTNNYLLFTADLHHAATNGQFNISIGKECATLVVNRLGRVKKLKPKI